MHPAVDAFWLENDDAIARLQAALPEYVRGQRWYPAKDAPAAKFTLRAYAPVGKPPGAALAIWRARVPGGVDCDLLIPLLQPDTAQIRDALGSDDFVRALLGFIADPATCGNRGLQAGLTPQFAENLPAADAPIKRTTAEQSNTSLRIGERMMLKVLRQLSAGIHPELEMGAFLTQQRHFASTPALLGWIKHGDEVLAILQAFVPNQGDGWQWLTRRLVGQSDPIGATRSFIGRLGERTAQLHLALGAPSDDPAFAPEPVDTRDWQRWSSATVALAERISHTLANSPSVADVRGESAMACFEDCRARLLPWLRTFGRGIGALEKTRHHGDFHLGQVLVTAAEDVILVDFEGEPLRDLAERRAKHIPLRDVAGMLRSFAYAAAHVERERGPDALLTAWQDSATELYLRSYFMTLRSHGRTFDEDLARSIIRYFSAEKALYEILYELANRPDWVATPLLGLRALLP